MQRVPFARFCEYRECHGLFVFTRAARRLRRCSQLNPHARILVHNLYARLRTSGPIRESRVKRRGIPYLNVKRKSLWKNISMLRVMEKKNLFAN